MKDITKKKETKRTAIARARIYINKEIYERVKNKEIPKGDLEEITKVVSFLGVKKTPFILPFCHNILVEGSDFNFKVNEKFIEIELKVTSVSKTGVEMDALFGVSAGILNIYDMLKFLKKDMKIEIELIYKKGGKSGVYRKS